MKVKIKKTDWEILPLQFGGNVLGWTLNEKESFYMLDAFLDLGFNFIDTANNYSWWADGNVGGESEIILGKWLKQKNNKEKVIIATKVGSGPKNQPKNVSEAHILEQVELSLKRLQLETIDLYYTHYDDKITPIEETLATYQKLMEKGQIKYIGASNISPERLHESLTLAHAHNLPQYMALQPHYNLVERKMFEENYLEIVEKFDLNVFPYYALASGFLTGKYSSSTDTDGKERGEAVKKYFTNTGLNLLKILNELAKKYEVQPAAIALKWLINKKNITAPIASATNFFQLEAFKQSLKIDLSQEDMKELNHIKMEY